MISMLTNTVSGLQRCSVLGLAFEQHLFSEWTVWSHCDSNGDVWDVAQHRHIREAGQPIWQVFHFTPRGQSCVLTSATHRLDGSLDEDPLYRANVFSLDEMLTATANFIHGAMPASNRVGEGGDHVVERCNALPSQEQRP
jgi:hypothetical protein